MSQCKELLTTLRENAIVELESILIKIDTLGDIDATNSEERNSIKKIHSHWVALAEAIERGEVEEENCTELLAQLQEMMQKN